MSSFKLKSLREGDERKGEWERVEIDGENVLRIFRVVSTKCCKHCKSQALPASKERGVQDGDVDVHDVVLRARFGGITQSASAFSAGTASSRGPVLGPDQAVLRRLTLGGRTVPTPFFLQQSRDRVSPGLGRFEATSQDDSLFPISQVSESSVWARHSETLQTPDCAAAARAEATYNFKTTISRSCLLQSTSVYYNLPHGDSSDAVLQWFSFIRHITHGKRMGIQRIWTD